MTNSNIHKYNLFLATLSEQDRQSLDDAISQWKKHLDTWRVVLINLVKVYNHLNSLKHDEKCEVSCGRTTKGVEEVYAKYLEKKATIMDKLLKDTDGHIQVYWDLFEEIDALESVHE